MINILLYQMLAFIIQKKKDLKESYKQNKSKISAPTWNEESELTDISNPVSSCIILNIS